ncbi:DmsC/YnfH family molybdoenzyme membrane anchor subunit [Wolinella succinogenes]|uniref:DmsC/YnfH family molybdoenzyme membrane anchor subunit n=1 Tax=Wolinella succinogenes TaxID=844 RepID=UPI002409A3C6|nr:DmsC/YnfH family molybdoenzyme membrane anchor subunit [Wolinella succinogenes]
MTLSNLILGELPLVLFTVMTQAVVGFSFVYALSTQAKTSTLASRKRFGLTFLFLLAIALLPSLFHLGDPTHAPYLLMRLGAFESGGAWHIAWLPNEILGVGVLFALGIWLFYTGALLALYLLPLAGIVTLFFMSGIYGSMQNTVLTWNFSLTLWLFGSSALFLGGLLYRILHDLTHEDRLGAFLFSLIGFALLCLSLAFYTLHVGQSQIEGIESAYTLLGEHYALFLGTGVILSVLALLLWFLKDFSTLPFGSPRSIGAIALLFGLLGVFSTRVLFYGLIHTHLWLG